MYYIIKMRDSLLFSIILINYSAIRHWFAPGGVTSLSFLPPGQTHKALSSTPSHQSSPVGLTNSTSSRLGQGPGRRPRGKPGY